MLDSPRYAYVFASARRLNSVALLPLASARQTDALRLIVSDTLRWLQESRVDFYFSIVTSVPVSMTKAHTTENDTLPLGRLAATGPSRTKAMTALAGGR